MLLGIHDLNALVTNCARSTDFRERRLSDLVGPVRAHPQRALIFAQCLPRVRTQVPLNIFGRPNGDDFPASVATFRTQINQPVAGPDHVQIMLNNQQGMPSIEQLTHGTHQLGNVVKMQARCWLIEHEERSTPGHGLSARAGSSCSFRKKSCQLQPLGFTATQCRYRLAQLDILQPDVDDGLERADYVAV